MAKTHDGGGFSPQRLADFAWYQREKPRMLRDIATKLGAWTFCQRSACRRGHACLGESASLCLRHLFHVEMTEEERQIFFVALSLRQGGLDPEAALAEACRRIAQQSAAMAELGFPAGAG